MNDNKVINFPNNENQEKNILTASVEAISAIAPDIFSSEDAVAVIASLLSMSEENFALISPTILMSLEKSVNNPNDRVMLIQALNASGYSTDDLRLVYDEIIEQIDNYFQELSQAKKDFLKRMLGILYNAISETEGISKRIIQIPIEICNENAKIPTYANINDAGLDVYALEDITIKPGETKLIKTGIKVAIPVGYEIQVRPKSGRALKTKMRVANSPGTIKVA